jgi:hypothetical protein
MLLKIEPGYRAESQKVNGGRQRTVMLGKRARADVGLIRANSTEEFMSASDAIRLAISYLAGHIRNGVAGFKPGAVPTDADIAKSQKTPGDLPSDYAELTDDIEQDQAAFERARHRDPVEESGL